MPQDMMKAMLTATAGKKQDDYTQSIVSNLRKYYKAQKQKKDKAEVQKEREVKAGEAKLDKMISRFDKNMSAYQKNAMRFVKDNPYRAIPAQMTDESGVETPLGAISKLSMLDMKGKLRDYKIKQAEDAEKAFARAKEDEISTLKKGLSYLKSRYNKGTSSGSLVRGSAEEKALSEKIEKLEDDIAKKEGLFVAEKRPETDKGGKKLQTASMSGGVKMPLFWKNALRKTMGPNQRETLRGRPYQWTEEQINFALGKK